jgi:outer membrane protein OmpA-like peptidoglycan-associated protein
MPLQTPAKNALKFIGFIALLAIVGFGVVKYRSRPRDVKAAMEIGSVQLPDAPEASLSGASAVKLNFPSTDVSVNGGTRLTWFQMAWNSQLATHYANGGVKTTKGSLYDKYKLQVEIKRQDDCNKSIADLIKFAQDVKERGTDIPGVLCSYMGDGMPAFFATLQKELSKLGPEYQAIAFGFTPGKSDGEDQVLAPVEWKRDPKAALGKTVACYLRDGDMNILLKWAGDNNLKVNPNETTYDSSAINLVAANDFLDAANKYITGYRETRKVARNGKTTGETIEVGVDAVATWTPGDVNVAKKKGGLITLVSTKQYSQQMPNITITIKKWAEAHRKDLQNLILATAQAGDQVRSYNDAKEFATNVSAKIWQEQDGAYWLKYYNGATEKDAQGLNVNLGGSKVFNLTDMANVFGLGADGIDRYKAVYTTFGDILSKMYPDIMPKYPNYESVVDKSYLAAVLESDEGKALLQGKALNDTKTYSTDIVEETSNKSYAIQFETGSAKIKPESYALLNEIFNSAVVAESLSLGVYGHTDNTGTDEQNQALSEARAEAVKTYLTKKGIAEKRIITKGYGSSQPVVGVDVNSTSGRAQNRRVQIVLGE